MITVWSQMALSRFSFNLLLINSLQDLKMVLTFITHHYLLVTVHQSLISEKESNPLFTFIISGYSITETAAKRNPGLEKVEHTNTIHEVAVYRAGLQKSI